MIARPVYTPEEWRDVWGVGGGVEFRWYGGDTFPTVKPSDRVYQRPYKRFNAAAAQVKTDGQRRRTKHATLHLGALPLPWRHQDPGNVRQIIYYRENKKDREIINAGKRVPLSCPERGRKKITNST